MTSVKMAVFSSLVLAVICLIPSGRAATCNDATGNKCVQTNFVQSSCDATNKVCACVGGYVPAPSGCVPKLKPPAVMIDTTRLKFVVAGQDATLICANIDQPTPNVVWTYTWKKDDTIVTSEKSQNYTIKNASASTVGSFSCKVTFMVIKGDLFTLESDFSEPLKIDLLTSASQWSPAMQILPSTALDGVILKLVCNGVPFGLQYEFVIDGQAPQSQREITFGAANAMKNVFCRTIASGDIQSKSSPNVQLPSVATEISGVIIKTTGLVSNNNTFRAGGPAVNVMCILPDGMFLPNGITYSFTDSLVSSPVFTNNVYPVLSTNGIHTIACSVTYNKVTKTSSSIEITFSESYIKTPTLKSNNGTEYLVGSSLIMTCGENEKDVTYSWTKDDIELFAQSDQIIQYNIVTGDNKGSYSCQARKNNYMVKSNEITITVKSHAVTLMGSTVVMIAATFIYFFT